MPEQPSVAIVIANFNGAQHLPACLDSVRALDYPGDVETIVVDNGSTDGSRALLRERYAWVRMLPQVRNLGFAMAVNLAASETTADCLALLNNDMRADPGWLAELVRHYRPDAGVPCVGGVILDWSGERVDFVGGFVNLHGFAGQERFGDPIAEVDVVDGRELPFACGGSMLIRRKLFCELGGFDARFFALLEDVDLGWRLRLAGHGIRLAADARTFHRHGATTKTLERQFLFERNALLMLLKNLDEPNLGRFLAFALFLLAERAALDPSTGVRPPGLRAVADVLANVDTVLEERARVQRLRTRADEEVFATFGRPFLAVHADPSYLQAAALLARLFELDREVSDARERSDRTEELRRLLEVWRDRYGVDRPVWWHLRRSLAAALPERSRSAVARLRRPN